MPQHRKTGFLRCSLNGSGRGCVAHPCGGGSEGGGRTSSCSVPGRALGSGSRRREGKSKLLPFTWARRPLSDLPRAMRHGGGLQLAGVDGAS